MPATKYRGDFRIVQFALEMHQQEKTAEDSAKTFDYYVGIPRHFAKGYDLVF